MNVFLTLFQSKHSAKIKPILFIGAFLTSHSVMASGGHAHDVHHHKLDPGFHLDFGVGVQFVEANNPWPEARLQGVLEAGSEREDEAGLSVSYLELGASYVFDEHAQMVFKVAKHGLDLNPEIEAAYIEYTDMAVGSTNLDTRFGRQQVPIGLLNQQEKHAWLMGVAPIAMRAVLNDSWRSDGLNLHLETQTPWYFDIGAWANRFVPGGEITTTKINTYSVKVGWQDQQGLLNSQYEIGYAKLDVIGRALSTIGAERHTHSLPSCDVIDENRICFAGDVDLVNAAAKWKYDSYWLSGEVFYKREEGRLDSVFGVPNYQSEFLGAWLDFGVEMSQNLNGMLRLQHNLVNHQIEGVNAQLISDQAKISDSEDPLSALGVAISYQANKAHFYSAEMHREWLGDAQNNVLLLRYHYALSLR